MKVVDYRIIGYHQTNPVCVVYHLFYKVSATQWDLIMTSYKIEDLFEMIQADDLIKHYTGL